jgi:surfactin synthase thioesterase subunit
VTGDWLLTLGAGPTRVGVRRRRRVIALPHAGGWPSAFRGWQQAVPSDVELIVAQLPGRGLRIGEPPLRRVEPIVEGLCDAVAALDPLPYAIVGHSFGSVVAYELTKALERKALPPRLLVVSARQPPCFPSEPPFAHRRTDAELIEHLLDIGGISPELVTRTDLVAPALAAIRADLEAMETYQRPLTTTAVPILALGSHDDPVVVAERLHLWSLETTGTFSRVMFRGGHFFIYQPQQIASAVDLLLSRVPV